MTAAMEMRRPVLYVIRCTECGRCLGEVERGAQYRLRCRRCGAWVTPNDDSRKKLLTMKRAVRQG